MSPSFARGLPFAYQRCGDDWSCHSEFNEYMAKRATLELELASEFNVKVSPFLSEVSPGQARRHLKRRAGETFSDVKRLCRPLHDANLRAFGTSDPHSCAQVRPLEGAGDGSAMQY